MFSAQIDCKPFADAAKPCECVALGKEVVPAPLRLAKVLVPEKLSHGCKYSGRLATPPLLLSDSRLLFLNGHNGNFLIDGIEYFEEGISNLSTQLLRVKGALWILIKNLRLCLYSCNCQDFRDLGGELCHVSLLFGDV